MSWVRAACFLLCVSAGFPQSSPPQVGRPGQGLVFEPLLSEQTGVSRFVGRRSGGTVSIEPQGFTLELNRAAARAASKSTAPVHALFVGSAPDARLEGTQGLSSRSHYLRGKDPSSWRVDVPHYARVRVSEAYPGVDIEYYDAPTGLEFDLILSPGADPAAIRLSFEGIEELVLDGEGALALRTGSGPVRQLPPRVFQERDGEKRSIPAHYVLDEDGTVGFDIAEYDESLPLLIDPVLDWATFLGGSSQDQVNGVAVDAAGFIYAAGFTGSANFPTANAHDGDLSGALDGFVSKLSADGTELIWSTFLGGSLRDEIRGLKLDAQGNIYVSGATESADFPTTAGAVQETLNGPVDAFVSKLLPDGSGFVYSTLFGGPGVDNGRKLDIDAAGAVYLAGEVNSPSFPATPGAFQTQPGGQSDAFVAKINPAGSAVEWATYFGGNGSELSTDIETDPSGGVLIAGSSNSTDFPGTANAFQQSRVGLGDGFIARFTGDGSTVDYFTYIGGERAEQVRGIALDGRGNVWAAGGTGSQDFPTTDNAPNKDYLGGPTDGFLARLPLPSRIVPGPPVMEPVVTYVGDQLQNFGLDVAISPTAQTAALSANMPGQAFGEFISYSLSNFSPSQLVDCSGTPVQGVFGLVCDVDAATAVPSDCSCLNGDVLDMDASAGGDVAVGGVGLADAPTSDGAVQPDHGGGDGTTEADGWVGRLTSTVVESGVEVTKFVRAIFKSTEIEVRKEGDPPQVGDTVLFSISVRNTGPGDITNVEVSDPEPDTLDFKKFEGQFAGPDDEIAFHLTDGECRLFARRGLCNLEVMPADSFLLIEGIAEIVRTGESENKVSVRWDTGSAEAAVPIPEVVQRKTAKLDVEKTSEPATGPNGLPGVQFTIKVTNLGPVPAVGVTMWDGLGDGLLLDLPNVLPVVIDGPAVCSDPQSALLFKCTADRLEVRQSFTVSAFAYAEGPGPFSKRNLRINRARAFGDDIEGDLDAHSVVVAPATSEEIDKVRCSVQPTAPVRPPATDSVHEPYPDLDVQCDGPPAYSGVGDWSLKINNAKVTPGTPAPQLEVIDPSTGQKQTFEGTVSPVTENSVFWRGTADFSNSGAIGALIRNLVLNASAGTEGGLITAEVRVDLPTEGGVPQAQNDPIISNLSNVPVGSDYTCSEEASSPGGWEFSCREMDRGGLRTWSSPSGDTTGLSAYIEQLRADDAYRFVLEPADVTDLDIGNPLGFLSAEGESKEQPAPVEVRRIENFNADFTGGAAAPDVKREVSVTADERAELLYRFVTPEDGGRDEVLDSYRFRFEIDCANDPTGLASFTFGRAPIDFAVLQLDNPPPARFDPAKARIFTTDVAERCRAGRQTFSVAANVNGASLGGSPSAGGLGTIFLASPAPGAERTAASATPLPRSLGNAEILFFAVVPRTSQLTEAENSALPVLQQAAGPIGVTAPLSFVSETQINYQVPAELAGAVGPVLAKVIVDGVASEPFEFNLAEFSPAVFTFDFGPGRAVAINPDGSVAHPADSFGGAVNSRPVVRGEALVILATGLGPVTPNAVTGFNSLDANGDFVRRDTVEIPRVMIGGVEQQVLFSGLSPEFVGVYQVNIFVADGTPTGDAQPLVFEIGRVRSRDDVTVAVEP